MSSPPHLVRVHHYPEGYTVQNPVRTSLCFTLSYVFSINPPYRGSDWYLLDNKLVSDLSEQVGDDAVLSAHRIDLYIAT